MSVAWDQRKHVFADATSVYPELMSTHPVYDSTRKSVYDE